MSGESFRRRVALLRDSWAERRQLKSLAGAHDFESQFALLLTLHRWAQGAAEDVRAIYGRELAVNVSPAPVTSGSGTGFAVTIGNNHTVTFALTERSRAGAEHWSLAATVGADGSLVPIGPERRTGQWTRARLEEVLLSVLGAYERAISEEGKPRTGSLRARA